MNTRSHEHTRILGGNIKHAREQRGLSIEELACEVRFSVEDLNKIEAGCYDHDALMFDDLYEISVLLGIELSELFKGI